MILSKCESRDDLLGRVANEFFEAAAQGEDPSIEDYALRYPAIADDVRRVFPALALVGDSNASGGVDPIPASDIQRKRLGDFLIVREIGRGGMGVVYEAEQLSLGRRVALKVLPFAAVMDEKAITRFKNEARAAATLEHPHIVPVFAVGHERGVYYYAMALIDGRSLAEVIAALRRETGRPGGPTAAGDEVTVAQVHGAPAEADAKASGAACVETGLLLHAAASTWPDYSTREFYRSVAQLGARAAGALHHAHERGIIHRDVKPGNLMIDGEGKPWVTDFGLARIEADAGMTMTGDLLGTVRYMAPEQALGQTVVVDHRADVYALGATLYELLVLRPAFDSADRQELLRQIACEEPRRLRKLDGHIPAELETIVNKAMAKDPEERYPTAQELAEDLGRFLDDEPIAAVPPTLLQRAGRWSRRHKPLAAAVIFSAAAIATVSLAVLAYSNVAVTRERNDKAVALARAERNYDKALAAVDQLLARVGNEDLAEVPQLEQLRMDVLQDALSFYKAFLAENPGDRRVAFETAKAYTRVGMMDHDFGRYREATRRRDNAIAILEDLHRVEPTNADYRSELASALYQRSWLGGGQSYPERAVELFQGLLDEFPENSSYRNGLAVSLLGVANYVRGGVDFPRIGDPRIDVAKGWPLAERILQVAESPHVDRLHLAAAHNVLASLAVADRRLDEAEAYYREAIRIGREVIKARPNEGRPREHVIRDCNRLGSLLAQRRKLREAEAAYRAALEMSEDLRRDFPSMNNFDAFAGHALAGLTSVLRRAGKTDEARQVLAEIEAGGARD